jgi:hypothetical protein
MTVDLLLMVIMWHCTLRALAAKAAFTYPPWLSLLLPLPLLPLLLLLLYCVCRRHGVSVEEGRQHCFFMDSRVRQVHAHTHTHTPPCACTHTLSA